MENLQDIKHRETAQLLANELKRQLVGKTFKHFKGNYYVVDNVAVHSETSEIRVIYHSKDDPTKVWDRNADMFLSPVDTVKYPDVKQTYRFEELKDL